VCCTHFACVLLKVLQLVYSAGKEALKKSRREG
jgi:hypothetical protein